MSSEMLYFQWYRSFLVFYEQYIGVDGEAFLIIKKKALMQNKLASAFIDPLVKKGKQLNSWKCGSISV